MRYLSFEGGKAQTKTVIKNGHGEEEGVRSLAAGTWSTGTRAGGEEEGEGE